MGTDRTAYLIDWGYIMTLTSEKLLYRSSNSLASDIPVENSVEVKFKLLCIKTIHLENFILLIHGPYFEH